MRAFFDRLDLWLTPLRFLVIALGAYVAIDLAAHVLATWSVHRHKHDGLLDVRVLDPMRKRAGRPL